MAYDKDMDGFIGQVYRCVRCGEVIKGEKLSERGRIACPHCGYRVIAKVRPPIVRRIRAV